MTLRLRAVSREAGPNRALKAGEVAPDSATLDWIEVSPLIKAFRRMVREHAYDVCELALTTYVCARAHGARFTALPVFLVRAFHHGAILVSEKGGAQAPKDLEGRRVGVNRGWTVTTGVWARRVLADEHGVDLSAIDWILSGDEHVEVWRPPANVRPIEAGRDMAEMLTSGELAAAVGLDLDHPGVRPLIPDAEAAGLAALRAGGVWPINHLIVVRDELLERNPGLGPALFEAFAEAKRRYVEALRADAPSQRTAADETYARVMAEIGDPLPYGIEPNRATLEALLAAAEAQGIVRDRPPLETLFAAETRALTG